MSMFEDDRYRWRETYFVLFDVQNRPSTERVQRALAALGDRYLVQNLKGDERGNFESVTVLAPGDFAALDICYLEGEEVEEQTSELVKEMKLAACDPGDHGKLKQIKQANARFDVLHFEQLVVQDSEEDDEDEMLDPGAALIVLAALSRLTHGVAVDPQSGTIV